MTREELRAGLVRLGALLGALAVVILVGASLLAATGRPFRGGLGASLGIAAVVLLLGAVGAHVRAGPLERVGPPLLGEARLRDRAARRESERIALGLVVVGLVCGGIALLLG